jgi:flagellar hook assembly protein FlgD
MPVPEAPFLAQNFPNPFNPSTTIAFGLKETGHVSLRVYDAAGRLVVTLIDESRPAGSYSMTWNGLSDSGSKAASGVYFYRLTAGTFVETRKMILLK